jgi:hypothetical protein
MIIAIHGKLGSGKDTTGMIIQYLLDHRINTTHPNTKDPDDHFTFMDFETWKNNKYYDYSKWHIKKFAFKLKQICSLLTGIPVEDFEKQEVKDSFLSEEWDSGFGGFRKKFQVRTLLQRVGTEAMRDQIHMQVWINALFADYKRKYETGVDPEDDSNDVHVTEIYPNWIITDLRFPNELLAVQKRKGITISVRRPGKESTGTHPSEIALDGASFDYTIINDGTIEDLIRKVTVVLTGAKLLK